MEWYYLIIMFLCFLISGYSLKLCSIIVYKTNMRFPSSDCSYKYKDIRNRFVSNFINILLLLIPVLIILGSLIFHIYILIVGIEILFLDFSINFINILKIIIAIIFYFVLVYKCNIILNVSNKLFKIKGIYINEKYNEENQLIFKEKIQNEEKIIKISLIIIYTLVLFPSYILMLINLI